MQQRVTLLLFADCLLFTKLHYRLRGKLPFW